MMFGRSVSYVLLVAKRVPHFPPFAHLGGPSNPTLEVCTFAFSSFGIQ